MIENFVNQKHTLDENEKEESESKKVKFLHDPDIKRNPISLTNELKTWWISFKMPAVTDTASIFIELNKKDVKEEAFPHFKGLTEFKGILYFGNTDCSKNQMYVGMFNQYTETFETIKALKDSFWPPNASGLSVVLDSSQYLVYVISSQNMYSFDLKTFNTWMQLPHFKDTETLDYMSLYNMNIRCLLNEKTREIFTFVQFRENLYLYIYDIGKKKWKFEKGFSIKSSNNCQPLAFINDNEVLFLEIEVVYSRYYYGIIKYDFNLSMIVGRSKVGESVSFLGSLMLEKKEDYAVVLVLTQKLLCYFRSDLPERMYSLCHEYDFPKSVSLCIDQKYKVLHSISSYKSEREIKLHLFTLFDVPDFNSTLSERTFELQLVNDFPFQREVAVNIHKIVLQLSKRLLMEFESNPWEKKLIIKVRANIDQVKRLFDILHHDTWSSYFLFDHSLFQLTLELGYLQEASMMNKSNKDTSIVPDWIEAKKNDPNSETTLFLRSIINYERDVKPYMENPEKMLLNCPQDSFLSIEDIYELLELSSQQNKTSNTYCQSNYDYCEQKWSTLYKLLDITQFREYKDITIEVVGSNGEIEEYYLTKNIIFENSIYFIDLYEEYSDFDEVKLLSPPSPTTKSDRRDFFELLAGRFSISQFLKDNKSAAIQKLSSFLILADIYQCRKWLHRLEYILVYHILNEMKPKEKEELVRSLVRSLGIRNDHVVRIILLCFDDQNFDEFLKIDGSYNLDETASNQFQIELQSSLMNSNDLALKYSWKLLTYSENGLIEKLLPNSDFIARNLLVKAVSNILAGNANQIIYVWKNVFNKTIHTLNNRNYLCSSNHIQTLFSILYQEVNYSDFDVIELITLLKSLIYAQKLPLQGNTNKEITELELQHHREAENAIEKDFWQIFLENRGYSNPNLVPMTFTEAISAFIVKVREKIFAYGVAKLIELLLGMYQPYDNLNNSNVGQKTMNFEETVRLLKTLIQIKKMFSNYEPMKNNIEGDLIQHIVQSLSEKDASTNTIGQTNSYPESILLEQALEPCIRKIYSQLEAYGSDFLIERLLDLVKFYHL